LSIFSSIDATIVEPERDTPGKQRQHLREPDQRRLVERQLHRIRIDRLGRDAVDHQQHDAANHQRPADQRRGFPNA
jgi:hypothetical protein